MMKSELMDKIDALLSCLWGELNSNVERKLSPSGLGDGEGWFVNG